MNDIETSHKVSASKLRRHHNYAKEPCRICGKHSDITQWHHVLPLKECAKSLNIFKGIEFNVPLVCLCPNCHAYAHKHFNYVYGDKKEFCCDGYSDEELARFSEVWMMMVDTLKNISKYCEQQRSNHERA